MFLDRLRASVDAAATLEAIRELERVIYRTAWPNHIDDATAGELGEILHAKRKVLEAAPPRLVGFTKARPKLQRSPDKQASIERRRRLAACWPLPPRLAGHFTLSEQAALRVVADDLKRHGICTKFVTQIAAIAGTCRTVVKNALRKARALRLLTVEERRRCGQRSLTNVVKFLCQSWRQWIAAKRGGVIFPTTTHNQFVSNGASAAVEKIGRGFSGVEIARSVPS
jgi:hypothetical protein